MPCYHPLQAFRSRTVNPTGKRSLVFKQSEALEPDVPLEIPCGQCIGCRLERSRNWAIRCVHEASLYKKNCFITLTYAPEHLPADGSLHLEHFQKFMKRLRKYGGKNIRFFHCGEYGEQFKRPHYHACLFNYDFKDKKHWKTVNGHKYYTSRRLDRIWTHGFTTIGDVTFESAAYVARYVTKKITGDPALEHYNEIDKETGEILASRMPEYTTMSRRPGIGKGWFDKFKSDLFPSDECVVRGKVCKVPKYYDLQLERTHLDMFEELKLNRIDLAHKYKSNNTRERLDDRKAVQLSKTKQLKRSYESGN